MSRRSEDIVALRVAAKLCLGPGLSIEKKRRMLGEFSMEEQSYVIDVLVPQRLVVIKKGLVYATKRLCEIYKTYLDCYSQIADRCDTNPFTARRCWSREWHACLGVLP